MTNFVSTHWGTYETSKNNQNNTFGRNLFSLLRQNASSAENGAGLDIINNY